MWHAGSVSSALGCFWGQCPPRCLGLGCSLALPPLREASAARSGGSSCCCRSEHFFLPPLPAPPLLPPQPRELFVDVVHPSPKGHHLLADLLSSTVWKLVQCLNPCPGGDGGAARRLLGCPPDTLDWLAGAAGLGRPAAPAPADTAAAAARWLQEGRKPAAAAAAQPGGQPQPQPQAQGRAAEVRRPGWDLPPPMMPSFSFLAWAQPLEVAPHEEGEIYACRMGRRFEAVGFSTGNFSFAPHKPGAPSFERQKWSWSGRAPGNWVEFTLDTRRQGAGGSNSSGSDGGGSEPATAGAQPAGGSGSSSRTGPGPASPATKVALGYLRSYESMGKAAVACVGGCTCEPAGINGFWWLPATLMQALHLKVGWGGPGG